MARKKRPFIDKENSVSFKLVERSQNDPLYFDENAPQYVLVEKQTKQTVYLDEDNDEKNVPSTSKSAIDRKAEQVKYGIYYDDDYDYLQHLVDVDEIPNVKFDIQPKESSKNPGIMLPSSLFESTVKEKVDLGKKAALPVGPQLDWDPDVLDAMNDDFDFNDPNNQIDDDFVVQAMKEECTNNAFEDDYKYNANNVDEEELSGDNLSLCGYDGSGSDDDYDEDEARDKFDLTETQLKVMGNKNIKRYFGIDMDDQMTVQSSTSTHFTEYSISSSVLPRNDNLKSLDEKFEQMYIREYADDTAIGALDCEEIIGNIDPCNSELMAALVDEYQEAKAGINRNYEKNQDAVKYVRERINQIEGNVPAVDAKSDSEYEEIEIHDVGRKGDKDRFDCESILSTCSNTLYHPKILKDTDRYGNLLTRRKNHIQIDPKTGIPIGTFATNGLSAQNLAKLERNDLNLGGKSTRSNMSKLSELSIRPKNETLEEKRQRKKELKEFRSQRRIEKKANRQAFQEEKLRIHKSDMNKTVQKKIAVL